MVVRLQRLQHKANFALSLKYYSWCQPVCYYPNLGIIMSNPNPLSQQQQVGEDALEYYKALVSQYSIVLSQQQQQQQDNSTFIVARQLELLRQGSLNINIRNNNDSSNNTTTNDNMVSTSMSLFPSAQQQQQQQQPLFQQQLAESSFASAAPLPSPDPIGPGAYTTTCSSSSNNNNVAPPYPLHVTTYTYTNNNLNDDSSSREGNKTSITGSRRLNEREQFYCFVKILLKLLEQHDDDRLLATTKLVIRECVRRNRDAADENDPLIATVERRLRPRMERYWQTAQTVLRHRLEDRAHREREAATAVPTAV